MNFEVLVYVTVVQKSKNFKNGNDDNSKKIHTFFLKKRLFNSF